MEDVLEVYQRPYDGNEVLVCMDETSKQQVKETRVPRPAAPGLSAAYDYEYERNGVSSLFMLFAPLDGWRRVEVRERRTKVDWAHVTKETPDRNVSPRSKAAEKVRKPQTRRGESAFLKPIRPFEVIFNGQQQRHHKFWFSLVPPVALNQTVGISVPQLTNPVPDASADVLPLPHPPGTASPFVARGRR